MKPHVLFNVLELVSFLKIFLGAVDARGKVTEEFSRVTARLDSVNPEDLAELVEIAYLLGGELADVGSATRFDTDETFCFEPIECFAYRRFANSKLGGERFLGESGQLA